MHLNHVALTVSNRETSATFYEQWFGMNKRVHEDDHLLILCDASGSLLALSEGEVPPSPPRTTHFGFQLDDKAKVHQLRDECKQNSIKEAEWQENGPTRLQVFDPDGYRVEWFAF